MLEKNNGKILLIEDDQHHAALLTRWLKNTGGFEISVISDGLSGSQFAMSDNWDLIISDVNLPLINGFDIVRNCKLKCPDTPVLLITGQETLDYAMQAIKAKADDLLIKPFDRQEIVEKSASLIQKKREGRKSLCVLAIGAHPDDIEVGCGATLSKHSAGGDSIHILTLGFGEADGFEHVRKTESELAAEMLNANVRWGNLEKSKIFDSAETVALIEAVVKELQPDIIYTHSSKEKDYDHLNTHLATVAAAHEVPNIYCYQSYATTVDFRPTIFTDISDFLEKKQWLVSQHQSQLSQNTFLSEKLIEAAANYWGHFAGKIQVEPFEVVRENR